MSILINLLPDLKQAKLRERRRRQMVSGTSILIWVVCGVAVVIMLVVMEGQNVVIGNLTRDINNNESQLRAYGPNLIKSLTADQHLASLPSLYAQRVYMTKFFQAYQAADPTDISLSTMTVDNQNNLSVTGSAPSYSEIAKLARALSDDNITVGNGASASNMPYFSDVNITSAEQSSNGIDFTITGVVQSAATSAPGSNSNTNMSGAQ